MVANAGRRTLRLHSPPRGSHADDLEGTPRRCCDILAAPFGGNYKPPVFSNGNGIGLDGKFSILVFALANASDGYLKFRHSFAPCLAPWALKPEAYLPLNG